MSTPRFVTLPNCVTRRDVTITRGRLAALLTTPDHPSFRALFVPGFTGSKEDFLSLMEPLARAGTQLVAYDQLGQFESTGPDDEQAYSLPALAADVIAISRTLWPEGPRPHLVGHSLGGLVARTAVLTSPADFASLTLMASGPSAIPAHKRDEVEALRSALPETDLEAIWNLRVELDRLNGVPPQPPEVTDFLRRRWLLNNPYSLRAKASALLDEPDKTPELAAIAVPKGVVYGLDDDVWWPEVQAHMARTLGCPEIAIPAAGHSPAVDSPDNTVRALLRIWDQERAGSPSAADGLQEPV